MKILELSLGMGMALCRPSQVNIHVEALTCTRGGASLDLYTCDHRIPRVFQLFAPISCNLNYINSAEFIILLYGNSYGISCIFLSAPLFSVCA